MSASYLLAYCRNWLYIIQIQHLLVKSGSGESFDLSEFRHMIEYIMKLMPVNCLLLAQSILKVLLIYDRSSISSRCSAYASFTIKDLPGN